MKKKQTICFLVGEHAVDLELCVFCKRMKDVSKPGGCEHYAEEYDGGVCSQFIRVEDVSERLSAAVKVRSAGGVCGNLIQGITDESLHTNGGHSHEGVAHTDRRTIWDAYGN